VLVYRGTGFDAAGNPTFAAPVSYPVGTNPVSVTIQDLNGDGIPDLVVANQGSNDVSILFGSWDSSGNWVGTACRPRPLSQADSVTKSASSFQYSSTSAAVSLPSRCGSPARGSGSLAGRVRMRAESKARTLLAWPCVAKCK
jgi:hypothetical protein